MEALVAELEKNSAPAKGFHRGNTWIRGLRNKTFIDLYEVVLNFTHFCGFCIVYIPSILKDLSGCVASFCSVLVAAHLAPYRTPDTNPWQSIRKASAINAHERFKWGQFLESVSCHAWKSKSNPVGPGNPHTHWRDWWLVTTTK